MSNNNIKSESDIINEWNKSSKSYSKMVNDQSSWVKDTSKIINFEINKLYNLNNNKKKLNILDFGCGNGQLSLQLANNEFVNHIDAIDISDGMINVYNEKINLLNIKNITTEACNITDYIKNNPDKLNSYDVIISGSVLTFVPNIYETLEQLNSLIKNDGIHIHFCYEKSGGGFFKNLFFKKKYKLEDDQVDDNQVYFEQGFNTSEQFKNVVNKVNNINVLHHGIGCIWYMMYIFKMKWFYVVAKKI